MKIIDFEKKGNMVRFFLGDDKCKDYWGDDWDDRPYEHNAGEVYDQFIKGHVDICFGFDDVVLEPADGAWSGNSNWCKDDMKNRKVPCICVLSKEFQEKYTCYDSFSDISANDKTIRIYFGDKIKDEWGVRQEVVEYGRK